MKPTANVPKATGVFFILAAISSIIGLKMYDPLLSGSDYLVNGAAHANQIIWGALMELILVISAVGTSVTLFPYLRRYNESIALSHLCFRFMEAAIIVVGIISMLSLLTISQAYVAAGSPDASTYQASGTLLKAVHDWTFLLGPNFMLGINTMMYSYIFYRTGLIPRFIPILGMTGATLVFIAALLEMFGVIEQISVWGAVLCLPVAANEMTLAVWLIAKGYNRKVLSSMTVEKAM
ncbi:uncharacterized protein DUF4386 [Paenibacillus taihuensis]|uniref:Uncharacterized protein DUF4386 n=1 Tax=Paenibacillus taihuensis TaxID=1156355 RepID=A0A3D9RMG9_9BACL|nr:DUF4386 domain-containing protein [Paenibacillus taihuensis]REE80987.1 uncharacterized protein DUF4386 [Paenibacillus taihuensis]